MNLPPLRALALPFLLLAPLGPASAQEGAANPSKPAQGIGQPAVAATASQDQSPITRYFRDLAAQEQLLTQSYDHLASAYEEMSGAGARVEMQSQFRRLAEAAKKAAVAAANLAAYHGYLAEMMDRGVSPVAGMRATRSFAAFGK